MLQKSASRNHAGLLFFPGHVPSCVFLCLNQKTTTQQKPPDNKLWMCDVNTRRARSSGQRSVTHTKHSSWFNLQFRLKNFQHKPFNHRGDVSPLVPVLHACGALRWRQAGTTPAGRAADERFFSLSSCFLLCSQDL